jgi:hypothetical protein
MPNPTPLYNALNSGVLIAERKKRELFHKILKQTNVSQATLYRWLGGELIPSDENQVRISKILKLPKRKLFPSEV